MDNFVCTHMTQLASFFWRTVWYEHGKVASIVVSKPTGQVHHLWERNMSLQSHQIAGNMENDFFKKWNTTLCSCDSLPLTVVSYVKRDVSRRNQHKFGEGMVGMIGHTSICRQVAISSYLLCAMHVHMWIPELIILLKEYWLKINQSPKNNI